MAAQLSHFDMYFFVYVNDAGQSVIGVRASNLLLKADSA